jgi:hypothetical protein
MIKYEAIFEDTEAMFNSAIEVAGLNRYMNIGILANNKAKKLFNIKKSDDLHKYRTSIDVEISINEKIFEQLPLDQQLIVVDSIIAYVSFNTEKDMIELKNPEFKAHKGVISKHTYEVLNVVEESIKSLYRAEKEAEDAIKATTEKAKKSNKF